MSIQNQINRINDRVSESYAAAQSKGATMPSVQNSDNLPNTISTIPQGGGGGGLAITEVSDVTQGINVTYVRQNNIVFATVVSTWGWGVGPFWTTIPSGWRATYPASSGVAAMDYNMGISSAANLTASGSIMELYMIDGNTSFSTNWIISLSWVTTDALPAGTMSTEDVSKTLAELQEKTKSAKESFEKLMKLPPEERKAAMENLSARKE